jgi:mono/diheme cytochrome c family protein
MKMMWSNLLAALVLLVACSATLAQSPANGMALYSSKGCVNCHGADPKNPMGARNILATIGGIPNITQEVTQAIVQAKIDSITPDHVPYRAGGGLALTAGELADLSAYLRALALNIAIPVATPEFALTAAGSAVTAHNFGSTVAGASLQQTVYFRNAGTAALTIAAGSDAIALSGTHAAQFSAGGMVPGGTTQCVAGLSLAAGQSCTLTLVFSPSAAVNVGVAQTATLTIRSSASASGTTLGLTGMRSAAPAPTMTLSPAGPTYNIGTVQGGSMTAPTTITVTNSGTLALNWANPNGIELGGANAADFQVGGTCSVGVPVGMGGGTCTITVVFRPAAGTNGPRTATLTLRSDAPNSPLTLTLNGTAGNPTPIIELASASDEAPLLRLTSNGVGIAMAGNVFLRNRGAAPMTITNIQLVAGSPTFAISPGFGCIGAQIAPNSQCVVTVTYTPPGIPSPMHTGTIRVTTAATTASGTAGPHDVQLQGMVVIDPSTQTVVSADQDTVSFRGVPVGQQSTARRVTLTNVGGANLNVTMVRLGQTGNNANFQASAGTCAIGGITPGNSCSIEITFRPRTAGLVSDTLTVMYNGGQMNVTVSGVGQTAEPNVSVGGGGTLSIQWLLALTLSLLAASALRRPRARAVRDMRHR